MLKPLSQRTPTALTPISIFGRVPRKANEVGRTSLSFLRSIPMTRLTVGVVLIGALACACAAPAEPDDAGCKWSWKALGCTPSTECKLKFAPRWGTFGPCVTRPLVAAASEPAKTEPAKEACSETAPAESKPVPESTPAATPAASTEAPAAPAQEEEPAAAEEVAEEVVEEVAEEAAEEP